MSEVATARPARPAVPRPSLSATTAAGPESPVRVLHLEDNRIDARIVRKLFAADFPDTQVTQVSTRFAFLGELELRSYDLIVSDFSLGAFDGYEALGLARERAPGVPFVFYSATIGDDRGLEALQHGARDYVPKGQVKRLSAAIRRALGENGERRRLREAEADNLRLRGALAEALRAQGELEKKNESIPRLENMGQLTAAVAHDLNNLLAPLMMAVPMLRESVPDPLSKRLLGNLERSTLRGAALVGQILSMAQGGSDAPSDVPLAELIPAILVFIRASFPPAILIEENIPHDLWTITAIPAQVSQLLLNLCQSARAAMPSGGALTVAAENTRLDETAARLIDGGRAGDFVLLRIEDTGRGITPEALRRLWEPKAASPGDTGETDLALLAVRNIVRRHGGFIHVASVLGLGSSFRIFLPAKS